MILLYLNNNTSGIIRMTHNTKRILSKSKSTKSANSQKKGLPIFLGKVFAVTGDFGPSYPHIGISRWITCHGGEVKNEVTEETTHLICSIGDYKKKVPHGRLFFHFRTTFLF